MNAAAIGSEKKLNCELVAVSTTPPFGHWAESVAWSASVSRSWEEGLEERESVLFSRLAESQPILPNLTAVSTNDTPPMLGRSTRRQRSRPGTAVTLSPRPGRWRPFALETSIDHRFFLLLSAPFVGSFLGVVIERHPIRRSILIGRSACPHCGHVLAAVDLLPLVSWVASRARCRYCRHRIAWFYPAIEIAALVIAVWSLAVLPGWLAWAGCGLGWTLLALAVIDQRWYRLPQSLTLPLALGGFLVAWLIDPNSILDHVAGAGVAVLAFAAIGWLYRRVRRREGLGEGDSWLLGAIGAWVSWQGLSSVVLYACISGLLWTAAQASVGRPVGLRSRLPFGPHLCLAAWLVWLYGPLQLGQ